MSIKKTRIVVEPDIKASYILIGPNGWLLDNAAHEMTPVEICDCKKEKLKEARIGIPWRQMKQPAIYKEIADNRKL